MPTYEYACKECGQHVEVQQSFTDEPLTICEKCGGALRKVFGSIGVSFKGSGFYRTDSRSGSGSKPAEKKADSDSGTKDSTKDSGTKDSGGKDSGGKDSGSKDSGSKDSGGKDSSRTKSTETSSSSSTSEAKTA